MSSRIRRIRMTAKNFARRANFFLQSSSLFLRVSVSSRLNKESIMVRRFKTPRQSRYRFAGHNGYRAGQRKKGL